MSLRLLLTTKASQREEKSKSGRSVGRTVELVRLEREVGSQRVRKVRSVRDWTPAFPRLFITANQRRGSDPGVPGGFPASAQPTESKPFTLFQRNNASSQM